MSAPSPGTPVPAISVILPTLNAAADLHRLVPALREQRQPPAEIVVLDSSSRDGTAGIARELGCRVVEIAAEDFSHSGTRNLGAQHAVGSILVFMTQDAVPHDPEMLGALVAPLLDGRADAAYARQIAPADCAPTERFARSFNYPETGHLKTLADLPRMGVKTYFFSNTTSAVRRSAFEDVGGLPGGVIVNEDMLLCARLLQAGRTVAYAAEARVWHGHRYSLRSLFRRYFDIGVFMQMRGADLPGSAAGGAGRAFAVGQARWLMAQGHALWLPWSALETATKLLAFQLGKRHRLLGRGLCRRLSGQKAFWARS